MGGFTLRVKTDEEYQRLFNILKDENIGTYLFKNFKDAKNNFERLKNKELICYLLLDEDNNDIGMASARLFPAIKKAVLDVGAKQEYRGLKIKKAAKAAIEDFFSDEALKDYDLFSFVKAFNRKSLIFSQQMGLKIFNKVNNHYVLRFKK